MKRLWNLINQEHIFNNYKIIINLKPNKINKNIINKESIKKLNY
jgi:hypothetical protein